MSGYRHTQTQTAEAVTEACRYHSGHSTSISGLFLLHFQGRAGTQINKNGARGWGAALWVGRNTNLTSPGLGPSPGTPPKCNGGSLCPRPVGQIRGSTSEGEGPPRTGRSADPHPHIHVHVCLLRPAASRPPATGPRRQLPPGCPQHRSGQGHEDSGALWAASRA